MIALVGAAWAQVQTATHEGTLVGERIEWSSTFHGERDVCTPVRPGDRVLIGAVNDGLACAEGPLLRVERSQFVGALEPPLGAPGIHRITLKGTHFEPDPGLGMQKTASGWTAPGVSRTDRLHFDTDLRKHGVRGLQTALYLRDPENHALPGELVQSTITSWTRLGMGLGLGLVVALGGVFYRRLDGLARRERIEAWMADATVRTELDQDGIV